MREALAMRLDLKESRVAVSSVAIEHASTAVRLPESSPLLRLYALFQIGMVPESTCQGA